MDKRLQTVSQMLEEEALISIKTLCRHLDVPEKTVRTWVYRRVIPYHKVGKLVRFNFREIRAWYGLSRIAPLTPPGTTDRMFPHG